MLFSDIRNFTGITAGKPSAYVLKWLNRYFTAMDEVIRAHGGFLNKFIGDGLLVVYRRAALAGRTRGCLQCRPKRPRHAQARR